MKKFQMIPEVSACDMPDLVREELIDFDSELYLHGDRGCILTLRGETLKELPLFIAWMIEIGAWTEEDVKLPSYRDFCQERGYDPDQAPYHFGEFYDRYGSDSEIHCRSVAIQGT